MQSRNQLIEAIQSTWSKESSADPEQWSVGNPSRGQCDVSSFVAWEHLGGDLVLGQVHVNGEFQEHHFWNRIGGVDLDLTRAQFTGHETITEVKVLESAFLESEQGEMKPEVAGRIRAFRKAVAIELGV